MFSRNHLKLLTLRKFRYIPEKSPQQEELLTKISRYVAIGRIYLSGYKSPDLDYKIMESGLQYAVNACQNAIVNGDQKLLSQMFCDDKESQANAKRIKNRWNKLSWSDKQILRKNISKDLRANRIRYAVKVGADDRCYLLLSAQIRYTMTGHTIHFHVWDAAMSEEHRENFE